MTSATTRRYARALSTRHGLKVRNFHKLSFGKRRLDIQAVDQRGVVGRPGVPTAGGEVLQSLPAVGGYNPQTFAGHAITLDRRQWPQRQGGIP